MVNVTTNLDAKILRGTLDIRQELGTRRLCNCVLDLNVGFSTISPGTPFSISQGAATLFNGYIASFQKEMLKGYHAVANVSAVDVHFLADKRTISEEYEDTNAGTVVASIITNILASEGISAGTVNNGSDVEFIEFNAVPVSRALNELADMSGYLWWIDEDKNLQFKAAPAVAVSTIEDSHMLADSVVIDKDLLSYYNRLYIKNVPALSNEVEDHDLQPPPDGTTQTFTTRQPISELIAVTVSGSTETFGIYGEDEDKAWYYIPNQPQLYQDADATPTADGIPMVANYKYLYPVTVMAENAGAQTTRATLDSTSGIIEHVIYDANVRSVADAEELALNLVTLHSVEPMLVRFATYDVRLDPGDGVSFDSTVFPSLTGVFFVVSVSITDTQRGDQELKYEYKAANYNYGGRVFRFYEEWLNKRRLDKFRDSIYSQVIDE